MSARNHRVRALTAEGPKELTPADLPADLKALCGPDGPVIWIHAEPSPSVIQALDDMGLDEIAVKSLRDGPERPRVEEFADHLYVSLFSADKPIVRRAVERGSDGESAPSAFAKEAMPRLRELRLFLSERWIISVGDIDPDEYEILVERMKRQVFSRGRGASFIAYHI